jgi:hypothetical protein
MRVVADKDQLTSSAFRRSMTATATLPLSDSQCNYSGPRGTGGYDVAGIHGLPVKSCLRTSSAVWFCFLAVER